MKQIMVFIVILLSLSVLAISYSDDSNVNMDTPDNVSIAPTEKTIAAGEPATLHPVVALLNVQGSILANIYNRTATDMIIGYKLRGDLSRIESAKIEVLDDTGLVVKTFDDIPVQESGQVEWKAGQKMNPTPHDIQFQVKNPDGRVSIRMEAWSKTAGDSTSRLALTLVTPWHVVKGTQNARVTLKGSNFRSTSEVLFEARETEKQTSFPFELVKKGPRASLPFEFVSETELNVTLPNELAANPVSGVVWVVNDDVGSGTQILKVVEEALPATPVLDSIEPTQLNSSSNPKDTWVTIRGSNFMEGNTVVKSDGIPSMLKTEFVSANELRARIPEVWMSGRPWRVHLHAESLSDENLVSQKVTLEILHNIGNFPPLAPILSGINDSPRDGDGYVMLAPSPDSPPQTVKITGEGFLPGAKVVAIVNSKQHELDTSFVSSHELAAIIPAAVFSRKYFLFKLRLTFTDTPNESAPSTDADTSPAD